MAKIETLTPRQVLPKKCSIDNMEIATFQIHFNFGWKLPICEKHKNEILAIKQEKNKQ